MSKRKLSTAHSGEYIIHSAGTAHMLDTRKADESGWWLVDGGGIADRAFDESGAWRYLDDEALDLLFPPVSANGED